MRNFQNKHIPQTLQGLEDDPAVAVRQHPQEPLYAHGVAGEKALTQYRALLVHHARPEHFSR